MRAHAALQVRVAVHAAFGFGGGFCGRPCEGLWGDSYARISSSVGLPTGVGEDRVPIVPLIAPHLPHVPYHGTSGVSGLGLREELQIPRNATVFCSYGGVGSFNERFVVNAVCELGSGVRPNLWFLFANHAPFCSEFNGSTHIIHLPNLEAAVKKGVFISSCDAMLHARKEGETFGLAVGEFSLADKPVFAHRRAPRNGNAHVQILGDKALLYDASTLKGQLLSFDRADSRDQPMRKPRRLRSI